MQTPTLIPPAIILRHGAACKITKEPISGGCWYVGASITAASLTEFGIASEQVSASDPDRDKATAAVIAQTDRITRAHEIAREAFHSQYDLARARLVFEPGTGLSAAVLDLARRIEALPLDARAVVEGAIKGQEIAEKNVALPMEGGCK